MLSWATITSQASTLVRTSVNEDTFYALLAAPDAGWRAKSPVYVRPRWGSEHAGTVTYHFILRCETGTTMVSVADGSRVRAFVQEHSLEINKPKR